MKSNEITGTTQITIDEDVSKSKIISLIELNNEEERLDFKETFNIERSSISKSKIDLTCDIISMANTDGGYIIYGVKEVGTDFKVSGIDENVNLYLTPETIANVVSNFVDFVPKIRVNSHIIEGRIVAAIFVGPSVIPIPFKQDGQFGKNNLKFKSGELYMRHSAKSERATFSDWHILSSKIRKDERQKMPIERNNFSGLANRLDKLIEVMGGEIKLDLDLTFIQKSEYEIEEYFILLTQNSNYKRYYRRIINKLFNSIKKEIEKVFDAQESQTRSDDITRIIDLNFPKLIPIWFALNNQSSKHTYYAYDFADKVYDLYKFTFKLISKNHYDFDDILLVQIEIVKLVYIFGSISLDDNNFELLDRMTLRKGDFFNQEHSDDYWFRYIITWMHRKNMIKVSSLVYISFNQYKENKYLIDYLGDEEDLKKLISQVDYYQCLKTVLTIGGDIDCFPSFKIYNKSYIEEFLENYLFSSWTDDYKIKLADTIDFLDNYRVRSLPNWSRNWKSNIVEKFLNEHRSK